MRSPVYLAIKKCSETRKFRSIYGAAIQIRTGVHVPRSRLRGSPERPRIEMRFAQGMRSPVLPTVKEKPSKPEGFEGFWSCYPDSNWSPCPAEQAPREPGATSDQNALRAGDEVSSFAYGKRKPSKPEGFEGFWSCYPDSNWRPCPAEQAPREPGTTSDQNALRARG